MNKTGLRINMKNTISQDFRCAVFGLWIEREA